MKKEEKKHRASEVWESVRLWLVSSPSVSKSLSLFWLSYYWFLWLNMFKVVGFLNMQLTRSSLKVRVNFPKCKSHWNLCCFSLTAAAFYCFTSFIFSEMVLIFLAFLLNMHSNIHLYFFKVTFIVFFFEKVEVQTVVVSDSLLCNTRMKASPLFCVLCVLSFVTFEVFPCSHRPLIWFLWSNMLRVAAGSH